ncbi:hypothetical protein [Gemmatimonas sp.]|jgi:hypothetical protein|uniref:hypothetical protein n=1 Tax=Gemmatimonas sp. TaxID=1962908 RepID=UPI0037C15C5F
MHLSITLIALPQADQIGSSPAPAEVEVQRSESGELRRDAHMLRDQVSMLESRLVAQGRPVSVFFGGPYDEMVHRGIPEGEYVVEDPAFDPIGFYGMARIDRDSVPVVQWYRWVEYEGEVSPDERDSAH